MGGELGISVGPDTTSISTEVLSERAADAVRKLAEVAQHPRLPDTEIERVKGNLLRNLAIAKSSPQSLAQERFAQLLYGEHPYGRVFPTEAMLKGYTLNQVQTFYRSHYGAARARLYVAGNIVEGNDRVTADNWDGGVQVESIADPATILPKLKADKPYPTAFLKLQPAAEAFELVLKESGATRPKRDAVDERVVEMVRTGKPTAKPGSDLSEALQKVGYAPNVIANIREGVAKGIITDVGEVGGYPEYRGEPYSDRDQDGMPDDWETKHGLDPQNAADAAGDLNGDGYTNIEDFLNGLDPQAPRVKWPTPRTYVDLFTGVR